jgi:hypothetical protein
MHPKADLLCSHRVLSIMTPRRRHGTFAWQISGCYLSSAVGMGPPSGPGAPNDMRSRIAFAVQQIYFVPGPRLQYPCNPGWIWRVFPDGNGTCWPIPD